MAGGVPHRRVVRRLFGCALQQHLDHVDDDADTLRVVRIPTWQHGLLDVTWVPPEYGMIGSATEVPISEANDANVIKDGCVLVERAELLGVPERGSGTLTACGGVGGVTAAVCETIDGVWGGTD